MPLRHSSKKSIFAFSALWAARTFFFVMVGAFRMESSESEEEEEDMVVCLVGLAC